MNSLIWVNVFIMIKYQIYYMCASVQNCFEYWYMKAGYNGVIDTKKRASGS